MVILSHNVDLIIINLFLYIEKYFTNRNMHNITSNKIGSGLYFLFVQFVFASILHSTSFIIQDMTNNNS